MKNIHDWHNKTLGNKVVQKLKENYFNAVYFDTGEEVLEYILDNVNKGDKVGFGGSYTVQTLGVKEKIQEKGGKILDHGVPGLSPEEKIEIRRSQMISDLFLCSSNAVTLDGELVNVDGAGNRVAAMTFGPKKVIVVVGVNKICYDEKAAFDRIKMIAAPKNSKRLGLSTPCAETGVCMNCKSTSRICRVYSVMKRKPMAADITVVIVGEELGF